MKLKKIYHLALLLILAGGCNHPSQNLAANIHETAPQLSISTIPIIAPLGTLDNPIIKNNVSWTQELQAMRIKKFPEAIINKQQLVDVKYYTFNGEIHQGQLIIDKRLANDIKKIFAVMLKEKFPLQSVIPISQFNWSDDESMLKNNTSAFNYRKVKGKVTLSNHAFGQAIDINPFLNPYVSGKHVSPKGSRYDETVKGTLSKDSPIVQAFLKLGWQWGGHWKSIKDFQHFEKKLD